MLNDMNEIWYTYRTEPPLLESERIVSVGQGEPVKDARKYGLLTNESNETNSLDDTAVIAVLFYLHSVHPLRFTF